MGTKKCQRCSQELPDEAKYCRRCGEAIKTSSPTAAIKPIAAKIVAAPSAPRRSSGASFFAFLLVMAFWGYGHGWFHTAPKPAYTLPNTSSLVSKYKNVLAPDWAGNKFSPLLNSSNMRLNGSKAFAALESSRDQSTTRP